MKSATSLLIVAALIAGCNAPTPGAPASTQTGTTDCSRMAQKYLAGCEQANRGQGPCAGKSDDAMEKCLASVPDFAAECASLPAAERPRCEAEGRAFAACIGIADVAEADACFKRQMEQQVPK